MASPPVEDRLRDTPARAKSRGSRYGCRGLCCSLLACLAIASLMLGLDAVVHDNVRNLAPMLPINPCRFKLPPPTGFKCDNGALIPDTTTTSTTTAGSTTVKAMPDTAAAAEMTTAVVLNGRAVPVPIDTAQDTNASAAPVPTSARSVPTRPPVMNNAAPVPVATSAAPAPVINNTAVVPVASSVVSASSARPGSSFPVVTSAVVVPVVTSAVPVSSANPGSSVPVVTSAVVVPVVTSAVSAPVAHPGASEPVITSAVVVPVASSIVSVSWTNPGSSFPVVTSAVVVPVVTSAVPVSSANPGSSVPVVTSAVVVPVVTSAVLVPSANPGSSVPVVTSAVVVPVITSAALVPSANPGPSVPVVTRTSAPPPRVVTSEPAVIVPVVTPSPSHSAPGAIPPTESAQAPFRIVISSQVAAAPKSTQPPPANPANPAAPPITNRLNPMNAPFFNSPAYTQKVQRNLPGATRAPPPPTRDNLNWLDDPSNAAPDLDNLGSDLLTPISNSPVVADRDDAVFGRNPIAPGSVEQQGLAIPPQNTTIATKLLSPVDHIQGATNIPVAMSRGSQLVPQVEDNEQLDLTVRELRARYLRQLRSELGGRQTLRLLRHRRQRAIERRRAKGVQVRQGGARGPRPGQNGGRFLQRLARRFNGRGAIDVSQLAKWFPGNPKLQALARRIKGRRVNVGALARLFNRRPHGGRSSRGHRQQQVGRSLHEQKGRRGRRQPLSLRKIALRFPRASLDQIARRFPNNRGLRNLAQRFEGRKIGIRQLANFFSGQQGAQGQRRAKKPKRGINLQGLARRFPRLNINQLVRQIPRGQGLRNMANRANGIGRMNVQQLTRRLKQRQGRRGAVPGRPNHWGRSNRRGLMAMLRRLRRGGRGKRQFNLKRFARRFRNNPRLQGLVRKFRHNPRVLHRLSQRFVKLQGRQRQGLFGLDALALRFRGNRQLRELARRFPHGQINVAQLARRFPHNRQLQKLAHQLGTRQSKRRSAAPAVRRRQGPMGRSLINYADAWFKDIHRFNKEHQAKKKQGPMFNAHVVPINGHNAERDLGELAEMAYAKGWLPRKISKKPSFFDTRGSRVGGTTDSLYRRGGPGHVKQSRDFSVEVEAAVSSKPLLTRRGSRPSVLGEGVIYHDLWRNSKRTAQEIMQEAAKHFDEDLREPKGPKESLNDYDDDSPKSKESHRLSKQSARTRERASSVPKRPVNVEYGNDAYHCQCDRAALRRARSERETSSSAKLLSSKLFRVKIKNHPDLIPCWCVRRGSVAAVRSLRNVAKQMCPSRVMPSRQLMRNLAAFALPRVPAQAGLRLRPFGSGGHPVAVLQRHASVKEDQVKSLAASRVHRFGFQSKSSVPLESRVVMARLRLRVQAKDSLPGVCTVKDAAMAVKVGGKLVASRMFPDGTLPEGQVLTLIGRVPEATEALAQGRKVIIEAIVRYHEKECLDMTRFEVVHTAMCADRPKKGSLEGLEEE